MTRAPIVFFTGSPVIWGAELSLLSVAEHMNSPVELVASNRDLVEQWQQQVGGRARVVRAKSGRISRLAGFLSAALEESRNAGTIVVFDFYLLPLFVVLLPVLRKHRTRLVIDVHDCAHTSWRRRPYFWLTRFTDTAVCISEFVASQVRSRRVTVVRRPVDAVDEHIPSTGAPVFGTVGQVSREKKTIETLWAAHGVADSSSFVLRGTASPNHEDYGQQVRELGARLFGSRFRDEGRVPRRATMAGIDILILANPEEPFGRVAVEAQLAGTIVVGPASGGIGEVIHDGINGFTFAPEATSAQVAEKVREALRMWESNPRFAEEIKRSAKLAYEPRARALQYAQALDG